MPEDENHQQFLTVIDIVGCGTPSYRTFTDNVEIVLRYSHICNAVKRRVTNPPTQYVIRGYPLEQSFRNLIVVNIVASRYYPLLCTVMLQRRIKLGTSLFPFKNIFLHVQSFLCHDGEPIPIVSAPNTVQSPSVRPQITDFDPTASSSPPRWLLTFAPFQGPSELFQSSFTRVRSATTPKRGTLSLLSKRSREFPQRSETFLA